MRALAVAVMIQRKRKRKREGVSEAVFSLKCRESEAPVMTC